MPVIAGLDGCGPRWVFVELETRTRELRAGLVTTEELPGRPWDLLTIDVPIGLSESEPREADRLARKRLGRRHCTVFTPPIRPALAATTREEASAITRAVNGRGVGAQAFGIYKKVLTVYNLVRREPVFAERVYEFHPEVTFALWAGAAIPHKKKGPAGQAARQELISAAFGAGAFDQLRRDLRGQGHSVPADDLADAFAGVWTAERLLRAAAIALPDPMAVDGCGVRMSIVA